MTKQDWDWVTNEMKDDKLDHLVWKYGVVVLMDIEGVAELVQEYFNNEVLSDLAEENNRCTACGNKLDDEGNCPQCGDDNDNV